MVRELAMLSARLQRLEAAEYAILCSQIDVPPETAQPADPKPSSEKPCHDIYLTAQQNEIDARQIAAAFLNTQDSLDRLHKIEVHLRRAYNRTWDHLRMMQKERRKLTPQENAKRTYHWICAQEQRQSPSSVRTASLHRRPQTRLHPTTPTSIHLRRRTASSIRTKIHPERTPDPPNVQNRAR
jgi:hypothetical protein